MIALCLALDLVTQVLYLFAPLLLAAALSGLVMRKNWLRALYIPIDGGVRFREQPLFGRSKTWRGIAVAITGCILGAAIQRYLLVSPMKAISLIDYSRLNVFAFGAAMGAGAMLGELPNSFVKRRLGIGSGMATKRRSAPVFYIWDQIDLLSFTWPMIAFWVAPTFALVVTSITISLILHPLSSHIGFVIGARHTAR
jgi:hypothetical protein